ncbi:hypothetical protein AUJ66_03725 [Candidatus Desantisbacteria bacterium CG1_02_38_46]|uniref:SCP2 domain-containing protein n=2 Tax=unclassified Candidatus Desantisiibacteriota TaxID=3106372 RepID=A0A2H9PD75_9BACT|nr:MAG: hypothetical protein AUJ66_03725 [Candidatus Desantisbacteria bacterium CG1_02_38_46]PIZ17407.1 MAG: hypothetical protein COY51_00240 [Candidatus Desantisbacteria bacterium CG_4_10_14_0_8_um_filter_39_17]
MNIIELTKKAVELANRDEKLKEKIKNTVVTIVMLCKNGEDQAFTFSVDKGEMSFSEKKLENPDFQFEISKKDYFNLMTGKAFGMVLMATGKMKITKGTWVEINKIATPLGIIPKLGKQIASKEQVYEG